MNENGMDLNNPFYMYMLMKQKNSQHLFNHLAGYNPFLMDSPDYGYNVFGNVDYLSAPISTHKYGLKDLVLQHLGYTRQLGLNNDQANLAAAQSHTLALDNFGVTAFSTAAQIGTLALGGWAGIPIGMAVDATAGAFKKNMEKFYAQDQKINLMTSNMIGADGTGTGLNKDEVKSIAKHIRKLAVNDDLLSADDIQDMMLKFTKTGFLNNVNSSEQFKQVTTMLKNHVKDLAEFLGETNPSKLLDTLAKYKSLGFTGKQTFDVLKSFKIASDMSGINKQVINQMVGVATSQENPLAIDRRLMAKQIATQLYQVNYLARNPFHSNYLSNKKELANAYLTANEKAEGVLDTVFGYNTNKDTYLAMVYAKKHGIKLQSAFDKIQKMNVTDKNKLITKYSNTVKDFGRIFNDKNTLATIVQEDPEVGGLNIKRTPVQRLIDRIIKMLGKSADTEKVVNMLSMHGYSPKELSAITPLIKNRLVFGNWKTLDTQYKVADYKKKVEETLNQAIAYKQHNGFINNAGRAFRGASNWLSEKWGGFWGDHTFDKIKLQESARRFKPEENTGYSLLMRSRDFSKITGAKNFNEYLKNLVSYSKGGPLSGPKNKTSQKDIDEGLKKAATNADESGFSKYYDSSFVRYQYKKTWLKNNVSNPYEYFKNLYKEKATMMHNHYEKSRGLSYLTDGVFKTEEVSSFLNDKKNKKYASLITDTTNRGDFEVRVLANLNKKNKLHNTGQANQIVKASALYYDLASKGKEKDFDKELKEKRIKLNKDSTNMIKSIYENNFDKTNIKTKLLQSVIKGDKGEFAAILDNSHLSTEDYESIKGELKKAGIDKNSAYFNMINKGEFGSLKNLFSNKHAKEKISSTEEFLGSLNKYKINDNVRKNLISAIVSGNKNKITDALSHIKNKQVRESITESTLKYINSTKDLSESDREKLFKVANADIYHKAIKNKKNIFSLLGLSNTSSKEQNKILSEWSSSPFKALEEINKQRLKMHKSALGINDLNRIQTIVTAQNKLGLTMDKDKKTIDFMKSADKMGEKTARTVSLTLQKQTVDILSSSKKILTEISESVKK